MKRPTLRGKSIRKSMPPALRRRQLFPMRRSEMLHGEAVSWLERRLKNAKEDYKRYWDYYSNAVKQPASKIAHGYTPSHIKEIRGQMRARQQSVKSLMGQLRHMKQKGGVEIW